MADEPTSDVLDLDALIREAEAADTRPHFRFKFDGYEYDLGTNMDVRAVALMAAGDLDGAMRKMMGDAQWQRLLDSPKMLTTPAYIAILNGFAAYAGVDLPNLSGSTDSSTSTAGQSKPTSNGTTASG